MVDRNGCEISTGDVVRFYAGNSNARRPKGGRWLTGVVRKLYGDECTVDDGDPKNPDLRTNGFGYAAVVTSGQVEMDRAQ